MSSQIIAAETYAKELERKYPGFDFPAYKLREWFSETHEVFFDCMESDKEACLQTLLGRTDLESFRIFSWLRNPAKFTDLWMLASKKWNGDFGAFHRSFPSTTGVDDQI